MTLEQFKERACYYATAYLADTLEILKDKNIEPQTKQKLVSTALSLILYVQDELTSMSIGSDDSISD